MHVWVITHLHFTHLRKTTLKYIIIIKLKYKDETTKENPSLIVLVRLLLYSEYSIYPFLSFNKSDVKTNTREVIFNLFK